MRPALAGPLASPAARKRMGAATARRQMRARHHQGYALRIPSPTSARMHTAAAATKYRSAVSMGAPRGLSKA